MTKITNNQFKISTKKIYLAASIVEFGTFKFLAATTAIIAVKLCDPLWIQYLSGYVLKFARIGAIVLFYAMLDSGLGDLIRSYYYEKASVKKQGLTLSKEMKTFFRILGLFILFRVVGTSTASLWSAPIISDTMTPEGNEMFYINKATTKDSLMHIKENNLRNDIKELEANEEERIQRAEQSGDEKIKQAINSGDYWQKKSYREEGFGWIAHKNNKDTNDHRYANRIKAAINEKETMVATAKGLVSETRLMYATNGSDTAHTNVTSTLLSFAGAEIKKRESFIDKLTKYFYLVEILAVFIGVIAVRLQAAILVESGIDINEEKSLKFSFFDWLGSRKDWLVELLEDLSGRDLNGDSQVGTTSNNVAANVTAGPTTLTVTSGDNPMVTNTGDNQKVTEETSGGQLAQAVTQEEVTTKGDNGDNVIIMVVDHNEKQMRSYCKKSFERMHTQIDPTTPKKNYEKISKQLIALGYTIHPEKNDGTYNVWYQKGDKKYGTSILS